MEEPIIMNETLIRMIQNYTDCIIREGSAEMPFRPPAHALTEELEEGNLPQLTALMLEKAEQHVLVVVRSERAYKVACALNETADCNHMAIFFKGEWDVSEFLKEIRYEDSLLTDSNGKEYCIAASLFEELVYADLNGRILLHDMTEAEEEASIKLCKKRDGSAWGCMLLDPAFRKDRFAGRLSELSGDLGKRAVILCNLLQRISLRNDSLIPVMDSVLVFEGGETLILEWRHPLSRGFRISDFCFHVLFGKDIMDCRDVIGRIIDGVVSSRKLPDCFLGELESVYILDRESSMERWIAALQWVRFNLQNDLSAAERRTI